VEGIRGMRSGGHVVVWKGGEWGSARLPSVVGDQLQKGKAVLKREVFPLESTIEGGSHRGRREEKKSCLK